MPKRKRSTTTVTTTALPPSGECNASCKCRVPTSINLTDYLKRVRDQPAYRSEISARGPLNSEIVQLALIEDYLSHSASSQDLKPKQVRLREGLRRVGARLNMPFLSHFNTKTTSLRTFGKALWDGCKLDNPSHKAQDLKNTQSSNSERVMSILTTVVAEHTTSCVEDVDKLNSLLGEICVRGSSEDREKTKLELNEIGICIHRQMVPEELCCHLLSRAGAHVESCGKGTKLTETMALGKSGVYFDTNWNEGGLLRSIQERVFEQAGLDGGDGHGILPASSTKAILLAYTEGAENWTHQDDNTQFDYQSLLMLSEPVVDFNGGELHVLRGQDEDWEDWKKTQVKFMNRGDVAIFRSNGHFFHGMDEVLVGEKGSDGTNRIAVGMFHKL